MHHCLFNALRKFFYFFLDAALAVVYVLYIINRFLGKIPINILPQFAMSVSSFFRDLCPYIINEFLLPFSQYSNFFNAMHTYSLITISRQIRASIFVSNTF